MAAQCTAMKGDLRRGPLLWIACARTSLPEPDSPSITRLEPLCAATSANFRMPARAALPPTRSSSPKRSRVAGRRARASEVFLSVKLITAATRGLLSQIPRKLSCRSLPPTRTGSSSTCSPAVTSAASSGQ